MKRWVLHAAGRIRGKVRDPLCGQTTGYGSKGCDQALIVPANKVTCKKCLRLLHEDQ